MSFATMRLSEQGVELLDQRLLPHEERYLVLKSGEEVARAIEEMAVRGGPAIGITAAMGLAVELGRTPDAKLADTLTQVAARLRATRPTAVNLSWALGQMERELRALLDAGAKPHDVRDAARKLAQRLHDEDVVSCHAIGDAGAPLVPDHSTVLTHCNAGGLATAGYGTALGVIRSAAREGRVDDVLVSETRPFLQGSRLTAWELSRDRIPVTLITDSTAGSLMRRGQVDLVLVGADRIAANGDVANKIGTYALAVLAQAHGIPFYVAAPLSTIDFEMASGDEIPIEQRAPAEVLRFAGQPIAPEGVKALHPAFDVTPAELVNALVTEQGLVRPPYGPGLARLRIP